MIGSVKPKVVGDEVAIKGMNALSSDKSERSGKNAFVGTGPPGRNGDRPSDAIMGRSELLAFKKEETDTEIGPIDAPEEVGKRLEVRFNSREDVKRVLSSKEILFEGGAKEV